MYCHLTGLPGSTPRERLEVLLGYADRMQIERVLLYKDSSMATDPTPEQLRAHNDGLMELVAARPDRVSAYAYVSPVHVESSLREIDRCVRDGPLVGVKLFVDARADAPSVDPIVERAAAAKALIFQHTWLKVGGEPPRPGGGNRATESTPMDLARLASRHPDTPMICGHAGGDWELGIRAVRPHPNIHIGVAGYDPTAGVIEKALELLGPERICYSSDFPGRSFASQLAKARGIAVPETVRQRILGGNLRQLLAPIFREKGMAI